ncbi:maleylpyruvate isomerase family mycothiol-dependent enzyme [Rhodococcus sp. NPDC060084]|uniref:maleylpyruvate isomerase family mycothiol-dependent enzyme n=1 Tax=Rhodococcus sp. NPDC060084 TaxID=3347053 RepID=UPI00364B10B7
MLDYTRYCGEITAQTELLCSVLPGRDMNTPVPTCPGWNVGQLARHVGYGHRWAAEAVRTGATTPPDDSAMRELASYVDEDPDQLVPWLLAGALDLESSLREAGPERKVWTPTPVGPQTPQFYARRFTHETAVHRADAVLALGEGFDLSHDVALDAVDEWLDLAVVTWPRRMSDRRHALHGPDSTLHFHATDSHAEWVVDLTGDEFVWRRAHEKSAVAVRGPLVELMLVLYRRRAVADPEVEVFGDAALLDSWLDVVAFG